MELRDRDAIRSILERDADLHLYELGDLDDFFWPHTRWFVDGDAIALLYTASELPVVLALHERASSLVRKIHRELPSRFYAHLSPGIDLDDLYAIEPHGSHLKMALRDRSKIEGVDVRSVIALGPSEEAQILAFYARSYPGNWFDPRMLASRCYFGVRDRGELVCVGGVHVYSAAMRVAALGNIATAPERRGEGLAKRVTARLCTALLASVDRIGLNVLADNAAAIACYERLGFERVAVYEEALLVAR